jgi:hypothetical protein
MRSLSFAIIAAGGLETFLAEIAAFPDGKHDDQVDVLSEGHLRGPSLGPQARPSRAAAPKVQIVSPKSRDQELYDRRQWGRADTQSGSDVHEKSFRCWLRRRRADFDPP